ncbi:hypothetical protein W822_22565 [Advenella kashmirensis W13003]|uniref:Uncharacterized protein n=1 Tax=Advenella kashmirensis W13003 TaxID=1424334 RepID=V8QMP6_9BURK|nr:hypothetical protein [Advenella kashmirensis]ETF00560.1 hypothetical protein W822_22565 [Advenella kashmirensis W13003]
MVKTSAAEFMQNHPPRKNVSILEPLRAEIIKLKNAGYSVPQILEFLAINDISVSKTALISFLKIRMRSTSLTPDDNDKPGGNLDGEIMTALDRKKNFCGKVKERMPSKSHEQKLVKRNGRVIDVNYKPSWVDDDINLADLI